MATRKTSHQKRKPAAAVTPRDESAPAIPQTPAGRKAAFLIEYEMRGSLSVAAKAAGIVRRTHYDWLEKDQEYAKNFAAAKTRAIDALETVAWDRAFEGSDLLLIFLLKANNPAKYRDRYVPQTGEGEETVDEMLLSMQRDHGFVDPEPPNTEKPN